MGKQLFNVGQGLQLGSSIAYVSGEGEPSPLIPLEQYAPGTVYIDESSGYTYRREPGGSWLRASTTPKPFLLDVPVEDITIDHGLGRYPGVVVMDNLGRVYEVEVQHLSENSVFINFGLAFSGSVQLI